MRASRMERFQLGSSWPEMSSTRSACDRLPRWHVERDGLVVPAPDGDRRVVAEQVDGLRGLSGCLLADRPGVAPLEREVLPDEHPQLVGGLVELGAGDVAVDAEQVEAGIGRQRDVAPELVGRGLGQGHAGGPDVGPLQEQALAVHRQHPAVHRHLAEPGAHRSGVAGLVVDGDRHLEVRQWLVAQRTRPPQAGVVDPEGPLDGVGALGQRVLELALDVAVERGPDADRARLVAVQVGPNHDVGPGRVGVAAQHPHPRDPHGARALDPHASPQAARVPRRIHAVPVLEDPGQVPLGLPVELGAAGHLHGQHVLRRQSSQIGDLVGVGEEVALGIAEVGAVEEHVGLVEDAVQHHPVARPGGAGIELEPGAVQERPVAAREGGRRAPVSGDRDALPSVVVEVQAEGAPAEVVVGDGGPPRPGEIHRARGYRSISQAQAGRGAERRSGVVPAAIRGPPHRR